MISTVPQIPVSATSIQVGRRVSYFGGYGNIDGEGVIVAVHGTPNPEPARTILGGVGRMIHANECRVDVILFDGRRIKGVHQCSIGAPGIGIRLLDRVHGPAMVERVNQLAAQRDAAVAIAKAKAKQDLIEGQRDTVIKTAPLFYFNGMKDAKGEKLQKCYYSPCSENDEHPGAIRIYARDYCRFSELVRSCFTVKNDSDAMTDYFDTDKILVLPVHPLFPQVKAAYDAQQAQRDRREAKRTGGAA